MASQKILDLREHEARKRISETIEKAKAAGVELGDLVPNHRFPDVGRVEELEYFSESFEKLVEALYLPSPKPLITPVEGGVVLQEEELTDAQAQQSAEATAWLKSPLVPLTEKTAALLSEAGIEASSSLSSVPDEILKEVGLKPAQIKNVRAAYGEYTAPEN